MADREKVIKEWEEVLSRDPLDVPWDLIDETLTLLKEQEVKMSVCDECGLEHPADDRYCPRCGKPNFD